MGYCISKITKSALFQFMQVCKAWQKLAHPVVYSELILSQRASEYIAYASPSFTSERGQALKARGCMVKKLTIIEKDDDDSPLLLTGYILLYLLSKIVPNVQSIDFSNSKFYKNYVRTIYDYSSIPMKMGLEDLQEIVAPVIRNPDSLKYHYLTCYQYASSITRLEIGNLNQTTRLKPDNFLEQLKQFKKLTYLSIESAVTVHQIRFFSQHQVFVQL